MYLPASITFFALLLTLAPTKGRADNYAASCGQFSLSPDQYHMQATCEDGAGGVHTSQLNLGRCIVNEDAEMLALEG